MLKGLDPLLSPELLHTLALMGHGDTIALVDRNFPAHSVHERVIRLDGAGVVPAGRAVLSLLPLDTFVAEPVARMQVVGDAGGRPAVQAEFLAAADEAAGRPLAVEALERHAFYDRARAAFAVVITGEDRPLRLLPADQGRPADSSPPGDRHPAPAGPRTCDDRCMRAARLLSLVLLPAEPRPG